MQFELVSFCCQKNRKDQAAAGPHCLKSVGKCEVSINPGMFESLLNDSLACICPGSEKFLSVSALRSCKLTGVSFEPQNNNCHCRDDVVLYSYCQFIVVEFG
jgi:hypothetical protein